MVTPLKAHLPLPGPEGEEEYRPVCFSFVVILASALRKNNR
jgi:hypothetical protein